MSYFKTPPSGAVGALAEVTTVPFPTCESTSTKELAPELIAKMNTASSQRQKYCPTTSYFDAMRTTFDCRNRDSKGNLLFRLRGTRLFTCTPPKAVGTSGVFAVEVESELPKNNLVCGGQLNAMQAAFSSKYNSKIAFYSKRCNGTFQVRLENGKWGPPEEIEIPDSCRSAPYSDLQSLSLNVEYFCKTP